MDKYCCEDMKYHANFNCDIHKDPFECPDKLILFDKRDNEYGLIIHDGGTAVIGILFCPWCGKKL
ncbi:hypothetical protein SAMN04487776_1442 [Priestia megaterium]|jgi:hypothetical protein|uniref:DUF6980 family protein n=1 Tax=Priestia megaterium TaxID=1404 RepID=UPI0008E1FEFE|nr:hypothetical protein SAMN04487776_1442 [Priestia megaterium]